MLSISADNAVDHAFSSVRIHTLPAWTVTDDLAPTDSHQLGEKVPQPAMLLTADAIYRITSVDDSSVLLVVRWTYKVTQPDVACLLKAEGLSAPATVHRRCRAAFGELVSHPGSPVTILVCGGHAAS